MASGANIAAEESHSMRGAGLAFDLFDQFDMVAAADRQFVFESLLLFSLSFCLRGFGLLAQRAHNSSGSDASECAQYPKCRQRISFWSAAYCSRSLGPCRSVAEGTILYSGRLSVEEWKSIADPRSPK